MPGSILRPTIHLVLVLLCSAGAGMAQSAVPPTFSVIDEDQTPPALIRSVRVVSEPEGPAVEIVTTRPLAPVITRLDSPARLVIDLPKSYLPERQKVGFQDDHIRRVRINQFQKKPPVVRVVVDLAKACGYEWDEAGNRLMVRLRSDPANPPPPPGTPIFTQGVAPASGDGASPVSGTVIPANAHLANSSITATGETAVVRLARGGEVRVCPGTTVSVTSSKSGDDLMLGMSTGSLEAHYVLDAAADSVLTPDFRILLPGPGKFDYAISADSKGNTCVRALPGNTAPVVISELMGDGVYQVKPSEQVVFHAGQLAVRDVNVPADCGCPASPVPVMRVAAPSVPPNPEMAPSESSPVAAAALPPPPAASETAVTSETASVPASQASDVHVQVEAPLVFRASDPQVPPPTTEAAHSDGAGIALLPPAGADSQPPPPRPPRRGFLGKLKNAIATLFR